ncbi:hypothetical protein [Heyndrickxia camelliae]|uniref:hypothetical protein n=1 Tax=Heyndrickxia camelliae TaxID=1707093 RepID=UPI0013FDAA86|nr:hypothetical protein [Heyndrickxia camelliae]
MTRIKDLYKKHLNGHKFKELNEHGLDLNIKHPSELIGNNPIMQQMASKHSKYLNKN